MIGGPVTGVSAFVLQIAVILIDNLNISFKIMVLLKLVHCNDGAYLRILTLK